MSRQGLKISADYILSLPETIRSLRKEKTTLERRIASAERFLRHLDRTKLNNLNLTGNPKLDAALRLSLEYGSCEDWLTVFPEILAKIERTENELARWKDGGLMLVDLTSQSSCPICLSFAVLEVPPNPTLRIATYPGSFHNIPFSIRIPGRLLVAWNSNTWVGVERCTDLSARYEYSLDRMRMWIVGEHRTNNAATTFDLTELFHPNWGTSDVHLSGVFPGEQAIAKHVEDWKAFVNEGYCMGPPVIAFYLKFLDDFSEATRNLAQASV